MGHTPFDEGRRRDLLPLRLDWSNLDVKRGLLAAVSGRFGREFHDERELWKQSSSRGAWCVLVGFGFGELDMKVTNKML